MNLQDKYKNLFIATTDTVLGIGAPISDENANLINEIKQRPDYKKLVIMVSNNRMAKSIAKELWTKEVKKLAKKYWPGAYTLVLSDDLSLRIPKNKKLRKLITNLGPIYMTSANISGDKPYNLVKAKEIFKDITKFYDFGLGSNKPSTIIDVRTMEVLR